MIIVAKNKDFMRAKHMYTYRIYEGFIKVIDISIACTGCNILIYTCIGMVATLAYILAIIGS